MLRHGDGDENQGQGGKDQGLDETNEEFKKKKGYGHEVRHQETDDDEQDLAGEDVAEKTEGKRDDLGEFAQKFEDADEKGDRAFK